MDEELVKRVLMIASHFPPMHGSSGLQRTLKFCTYLPEHGWNATVLTVHPRAHPQTSPDQLDEIPDDVPVIRAFALDTARHLSIGGRYPGFLAWPDRWSSWWVGAMPAALAAIRRYRPDVIWSTYPIATAHLIGLSLRRLTGIPWVADFRDSMTEDDYPPDPRVRRIYRWIERNAVQRSRRVVFTTEGTLRMYAARYPDLPASRWTVIENGYDDENFRDAEQSADLQASSARRPLTLVHSGILYPSERDPRAFFQALADLRTAGEIEAGALRVVLRASGSDQVYRPLLETLGLLDIVDLAPAVGYREALKEMLGADGLVLFQGASCNHQIPAKAYEYLRARRPILALTDPGGDTGRLMSRSGVELIAPLDSVAQIRQALRRFVQELEDGTAALPATAAIEQCSRRARTVQLAEVLDSVVSDS